MLIAYFHAVHSLSKTLLKTAYEQSCFEWCNETDLNLMLLGLCISTIILSCGQFHHKLAVAKSETGRVNTVYRGTSSAVSTLTKHSE
jgi:hypothetical protein